MQYPRKVYWLWAAMSAVSLVGVSGCGSQASEGVAAPSSLAADITYEQQTGMNPHPVTLQRPAVAPLSVMAQLGKAIFFDRNLSGSGQLSCASCHAPDHFYGPPSDQAVMLGGDDLRHQGARAVPSLMYLDRTPAFSIGPDTSGDSDTPPNLNEQAQQANTTARATKTAADPAQAAVNLVPQGGLFWDGRVDTLQAQANGPLFNPVEMDAGSVAIVAKKLAQAAYAAQFTQLFGAGIFKNPSMLVSEAMFAVARYQIEAPSFHPYDSKFDAWLEGKAAFNPQEMRGYLAFNDPKIGNCAACHLDKPSRDGRPPLFTDHQYEALGVPRNPAILANRDARYFDLGLCGPFRTDLAKQTQYCGLFVTPSLRNVATRQVFFHNGVYHRLADVLAFYDYRDTQPEKIYPVTADGAVEKYNDLPQKYWTNVDTVDAPFNRHAGQKPAMSAQQMRDIIAFLHTLTDRSVPN